MDEIKNNLKNSADKAADDINAKVNKVADDVKATTENAKKTIEEVSSKVGDMTKNVSKEAANAVNDATNGAKKGMGSKGIIISLVLLALVLGGYFLVSKLDFSQDSADGALSNVGKLISESRFSEATNVFDMDLIIDNMVKSDDIWKSALAQQGVTNPTAEQITQIREMVVNNEQVFGNFKKSIKQSFVDAIQGDDVADPDLLAFFTSLKDGTANLNIKIDGDDASFQVGVRKETWHMKKIDGKWKVYKIEFDQTEQSSTETDSSTSAESSNSSTSAVTNSASATSQATTTVNTSSAVTQ